MRDLLLPVDGPDLVEGVDGGGQTTMDTEDLVVDDGRQAEVVENFATFFRKKKKKKEKVSLTIQEDIKRGGRE